MNEKLTPRGEHLSQELDLSKESQKNIERLKEQASEQEQISSEKIAELQRSVEKQSVSAKEVTVGERQEHPKAPGYVQKELKDIAYARQLKHVRSRLNAPEKALSHLIHKPGMEVLSNISGKTIARPAGILAGGIFAFLGSLVALYMAKHTGFSYNYLLVLILFGIGYALATLIELGARLLLKKPRL